MTKIIVVNHIHGISVKKTLCLILTIINEGFFLIFQPDNFFKIVLKALVKKNCLLGHTDFVKVNLMISFYR